MILSAGREIGHGDGDEDQTRDDSHVEQTIHHKTEKAIVQPRDVRTQHQQTDSEQVTAIQLSIDLLRMTRTQVIGRRQEQTQNRHPIIESKQEQIAHKSIARIN